MNRRRRLSSARTQATAALAAWASYTCQITPDNDKLLPQMARESPGRKYLEAKLPHKARKWQRVAGSSPMWMEKIAATKCRTRDPPRRLPRQLSPLKSTPNSGLEARASEAPASRDNDNGSFHRRVFSSEVDALAATTRPARRYSPVIVHVG